MVTQNFFVVLCHCRQDMDRMTIMIACHCNHSRLYTQFRLYRLGIYNVFSGYMDYILPKFRLYGLLKYGIIAYMDNFSWDKRGPYIRN